MLNTGQNVLFAGKYRLKEHLGTGGFAEVWLANYEMANDTPVVVKIYSPGKRMDQRGIEIFRQEYALVSGLNHPNLLKPSHFDTVDGHPYLVMTYCSHGNLYHKFQSQAGGLPEKEIATIMHQIGGALGHLHENGIAHQDIKPDNVLIFAPGRYMLSDFGVSARIKRETIHNTRRTTLSLSEMEMKQERYTYITPHYASPEAFEGKGNTSESDIFSLGLMLYELANGALPFQPPSYTGEALRSGAEIPDLPQYYSKELDAILHTCMDPDAENRLPAATLSELADEYLRSGKWPVEIGDSEGYDAPPPPPPPTPKRPANKGKPPKPTTPPPPPPPPVSLQPDEPTNWWKWPAIITGGIVVLATAGILLFGGKEDQACPPLSGMEGYTGQRDPQTCEPIGQVEKASVKYLDSQGNLIASYIGPLNNGKKEGEGTLRIEMTPSKKQIGESYEGEFLNDLMHGTGTYIFSDGSYYKGEFSQGKISGEGQFFDYGENKTISGTWEDGALQGQGEVKEGDNL